MYEIKYMDTADGDFFAIAEYLDSVDDNGLADKIIGEIIKCVNSLDTMPFRFPKHRKRPQYRWCGVYDYMIFYKVTENPNTVEIHRILHGAQDIENIL